MRLAGLCVAATLALGAGLYALGGRAPGLSPAARPAPDVIGMRLDAARVALARGGPPPRIVVRRVPWAPSGVVGGVRGFEFDGAYTSRTRIVLEVGR
jgi:hypothetical protein